MLLSFQYAYKIHKSIKNKNIYTEIFQIVCSLSKLKIMMVILTLMFLWVYMTQRIFFKWMIKKNIEKNYAFNKFVFIIVPSYQSAKLNK